MQFGLRQAVAFVSSLIHLFLLERLLYHVERNLLATAKFLVMAGMLRGGYA